MARKLRLDEIGYWSEVKLDIIRKYAAAYSRILSAQTSPRLYHIYIDAFAGAGVHVSRETREFVRGSPTNALLVEPPFREYHFIDLDRLKVASLRRIAGEKQDVSVYEGDCNSILLEKVFPKARYEDYRRALCILDPYALHLDWEVIQKAGQMRSIDIFLNFPTMDMNMNVLWHDRDKVDPAQIERMNAFWGDDSWSKVAYAPSRQMSLLGEEEEEKATNEAVAEGFRQRLKEVAGFSSVPKPIAMRNTQNAILYYLFFASQKPVAENIVRDIFSKYSMGRPSG